MSPRAEHLEIKTLEHGPASLERIDYLDGWRGLAIAFVLQAHFMQIAGFDSGRLGVDLFFCLSGLLMAKLLFVKRTPLRIFYERRISRILPVFFLYLLTIYSVAYLLGKQIDISEMVSTIFFLRTYYPASPNIWSELTVPIGHIWSLNVEEHSYIFMSILTLIVFIRKREGVVLLCVGMAALLTSRYYARYPDIAPDLFQLRTECAASFIMISAGYSLLKANFKCLVTPVMPAISLAVAVSCYFKGFPYWGGKVYLAPFLLSFTVNHLSEASKFMIKMLSFRPLRLLGFWSYSIYLWQQPIYLFYKKKMYPTVVPPGAITSSAALVSAVFIGAASFYFFENPTRRWLNERGYMQLFKQRDPKGVALETEL